MSALVKISTPFFLFFLSLQKQLFCERVHCPIPPAHLRPGTWYPMQDYWRPMEYIWSHGLSMDSDTPPRFITSGNFPISLSIYEHVKGGDIVWVETKFLCDFYNIVFPKIHVPIVLLVNIMDESFPAWHAERCDIFKMIEDDRIIHIFAQNCSLGNTHPKITPIPIGIDYHTLTWSPWDYPGGTFETPQTQEEDLKRLLATLKPTDQRIPKAFVDFQHKDTLSLSLNYLQYAYHETRKTIFEKILASGMIDYSATTLNRHELWKKKGEYAFAVSPVGNGLDCYRTWESLILGNIVIVRSTPLDCLYEGLPVVIVQDWSEINEENMKKWLEKYKDAFTNPAYKEKLRHKYWMDKIRAKAALYKEETKYCDVHEPLIK